MEVGGARGKAQAAIQKCCPRNLLFIGVALHDRAMRSRKYTPSRACDLSGPTEVGFCKLTDL